MRGIVPIKLSNKIPVDKYLINRIFIIDGIIKEPFIINDDYQCFYYGWYSLYFFKLSTYKI